MRQMWSIIKFQYISCEGSTRMLKETWFGSTNFNTSHVKVRPSLHSAIISSDSYFNTSHVKVRPCRPLLQCPSCPDFNTSHVKVRQGLVKVFA